MASYIGKFTGITLPALLQIQANLIEGIKKGGIRSSYTVAGRQLQGEPIGTLVDILEGCTAEITRLQSIEAETAPPTRCITADFSGSHHHR